MYLKPSSYLSNNVVETVYEIINMHTGDSLLLLRKMTLISKLTLSICESRIFKIY